jgi:hypothetical protein
MSFKLVREVSPPPSPPPHPAHPQRLPLKIAHTLYQVRSVCVPGVQSYEYKLT